MGARWQFGMALGLAMVPQVSSAADMLVTAQEAALPDAPARTIRGLFPGPTIALAQPDAAALTRPLTSPFRLAFTFTPRNESKIDLASVRVIYSKLPAVDLTPRLLSSISSGGVDLAKVRLPPGRHTFIISVTDDNGRVGTATYTLLVAK